MKIIVIRKRMKLWRPRVDVVNEILHFYGNILRPNDYLIISDKALSVAYGYLFDESKIKPDLLSKVLSYVITRFVWGRLLYNFFSNDVIRVLKDTSINIIAAHKRIAMRIHGFKHFIKPVSEAGIDTSNLPKAYVSIPIPRSKMSKIIDYIHKKITVKLGFSVNILVINTDKAYMPKFINNLVFSTRPSFIPGIIDLGGYAYLLGKCLRKYFYEFPTPVAYKGKWIGLKNLMILCKVAEKYRGHGAGRNLVEMMKLLNVKSYSEITWRKLSNFKHYPVLLIRIV